MRAVVQKLIIRIPDDLHKMITAAAEQNKRSINGEMVTRLERTFLREKLIAEGWIPPSSVD